MRYLAKMIESLVTTLQSRQTDGPLLKASARILKLAPKLCRTLWEHRIYLRYDREILEHRRSGRDHDPGTSFAEASGLCALTLCLLHEQLRFVVICIGSIGKSQKSTVFILRFQPPSPDSFHPHVLLFVWLYGPKHDTAFQRGVVSILASLIREAGMHRMDSFVKDTISKTDATKPHPDDLSKRLIASLRSPEELDENLRAYFVIIIEFSRVRGTLTRVRSNRRDWGPGLAESMCIACQRQLCSGHIDNDDCVVELCIRSML